MGRVTVVAVTVTAAACLALAALGAPAANGQPPAQQISSLSKKLTALQATARRLTAANKLLTAQLKAVRAQRDALAAQLAASKPAAPAPAPAAAVGTRENPIRLGSDGDIGGGFRIKIVSVDTDATAAVMAANSLNKQAPGKHFVLARISATYTGSGAGNFFVPSLQLRAVGPSGVSYSTFGSDSRCGVIADAFHSSVVFAGGTIVGNVCWQVPQAEAGELVLFPDSLSGQPSIFFALHQ